MEAVGLAARKFEQTIKDQDSAAYNKLSEQWGTNVWEALMTLDCSNYSESIADVLKIFQKIGILKEN